MPPKKTSYYFLFFTINSVKCLRDFIHLCSLYWEGVYVRKLGLSLERQRLNMSKLERCKTVKALNRIMMNVFP